MTTSGSETFLPVFPASCTGLCGAEHGQGTLCRDKNVSHARSDSISNLDFITDGQRRLREVIQPVWASVLSSGKCALLSELWCTRSMGHFDPCHPTPCVLAHSAESGLGDPASQLALSRAAVTGTCGGKEGQPAGGRGTRGPEPLKSTLLGAQPRRTFPERPSGVTDPQSNFSRKRTASSLPAGFLPPPIAYPSKSAAETLTVPLVCVMRSLWAAPGEARMESGGSELRGLLLRRCQSPTPTPKGGMCRDNGGRRSVSLLALCLQDKCEPLSPCSVTEVRPRTRIQGTGSAEPVRVV